MLKLKSCPYCGGKPKLIRCGDHKEFVVYICSKCYKTPVCSCEARLTERGARKIWNKKVDTSKPTYWTMGWGGDPELGFSDGTYLPRKAALLLHSEYFDKNGNPILSALPVGKPNCGAKMDGERKDGASDDR